MNPAVFLDRDNTLIHNDGDLGDPDQVKLIQGAAAAVASLRGLGYTVVVVTNQGGVARGKYTEEDVHRVHERINEQLRKISNTSVDRYYFCPFHPEGSVEAYRKEHPNRKPQPGMLLQAAKELKLDLSQSWMIGDQMRDIEAGKRAGTRTILLHLEARERPPLDAGDVEPIAADIPGTSADGVKPDYVARTLVDAVKIVAQQRKPGVMEELRSVVGRPKPAPPPATAATTTAAPAAEIKTAPATTPPARRTTPIQLNPTKPAAAPPRSPAPSAEPPTAPTTPPTDATPESTDRPEHLALRQILHELRAQRSALAAGEEWSFLDLLAVVFQLMAAICLVGGLLMGDEPVSLLRWLGSGIILQLAAVAMLLFRR